MATSKFSPPLDRIAKQIRDILTDPIMRRRILTVSAKALSFIAAARPVEGAWNKAPGTRGDNRWYQRGFGTRYKTADGQTRGINNSQNLQKSWQVEIKNDSVASVYTGVTYAPFIHDPARRVWWAERHGWKTTDEIGDIFGEKFEQIALEEIDKAIDEIGR